MKVLPIRPLSPEWFSYRSKRVTGSTVAAIMGESKYSTPLNEWARITGRYTPPPSTSPYAEWGMATEALHRAWFAVDHGVRAEECGGIVQHEQIAWLCCTPDGFVFADDPPHPALLEVKAPSPWTADEWAEGLPLAYQIQLQAGMEICGLGESYLSVLLPPKRDPTGAVMEFAARLLRGEQPLEAIRASRFERRDYYLEEDRRFQAAMLATLRAWWAEHVETGMAPEATGAAADKAALAELADGEISIDFDDAAVAKVDELEALQAEIKERTELAEALKNQLTQMVGAPTWSETKKAINKARRMVG